jgi:hypothetical protein
MHPLSFNQVFVSAMSGSISIISSLVDSLVDLFTGLVLWLASHRIENHNPYLYPIGVCVCARAHAHAGLVLLLPGLQSNQLCRCPGRQPLEPLAVTICSVVMITASLQVIFESVRRLASSSLDVDVSVVCTVLPPSRACVAGSAPKRELTSQVSSVIMFATIAVKLGLYAYCKRVPTAISQVCALWQFVCCFVRLGAFEGPKQWSCCCACSVMAALLNRIIGKRAEFQC